MITWSNDTFLKKINLLVYGPPKIGKTVTAATISKFAPDDIFSPDRKGVKLIDVPFIAFEPNVGTALSAVGLNAPIIDLSAFSTSTGMSSPGKLIDYLKKIDSAYEFLVKYNDECPVTAAVVDTVSSFDTNLISHYTSVAGDNKYGVFDNASEKHGRLVSMLNALPFGVVFLAHAKTKTKTVTDIVAKAIAVGGDAEEIMPEIAGVKAANLYKKNVDAILALTLDKKQRTLLPDGGLNFEGGNRYAHFLAEREPPHLRKLVEKIRAGAAKLSA